MRGLSYIIVLVLFLPLRGQEDASTDQMITLEPINVQGTAQNCFGIDIRIYIDRATGLTRSIFITKVIEDTDAADADLQVGDEILKINQIPVKSMSAKVSKDSELGRILLNRRPGERLELQLAVRRPKNVTLRWPWRTGSIFVGTRSGDALPVVVKQVEEGLELKPGDEIVGINQTELKNLNPRMDLNNQIGRIFSNLPRENIHLKVVTTSIENVTLRAFVESSDRMRHQVW